MTGHTDLLQEPVQICVRGLQLRPFASISARGKGRIFRRPRFGMSAPDPVALAKEHRHRQCHGQPDPARHAQGVLRGKSGQVLCQGITDGIGDAPRKLALLTLMDDAEFLVFFAGGDADPVR